MKSIIRSFLAGVIVTIAIIATVNSCTYKDSIIIPEKEGNFSRDTFYQIDTIRYEEVIYRDVEIEIPSQTNKDLLKKFEKAKDSIEQLNLYINAIQVRNYIENYSDENLDITVKAQTTGTLDKLDLTYKTKSVEVKKPRNPIIIRGGATYTTLKDKNYFTPKVSLEDRKNNIYSIGGNKENISISVEIPIIKIK